MILIPKWNRTDLLASITFSVSFNSTGFLDILKETPITLPYLNQVKLPTCEFVGGKDGVSMGRVLV